MRGVERGVKRVCGESREQEGTGRERLRKWRITSEEKRSFTKIEENLGNQK